MTHESCQRVKKFAVAAMVLATLGLCAACGRTRRAGPSPEEYVKRAGFPDALIYTNASNVTSPGPGMLDIMTNDSPQQCETFYSESLKKAGFEDIQSQKTASGTEVTGVHAKDGIKVTATIEKPGGAYCMIHLLKGPSK
jgi:hypothetical protein